MSIYSASVGNNADIFPDILSIFVQNGSSILDATCGKGVFWRNVDTKKYKIYLSDLKNGVDLTNLPIDDCSLGALVIDPPYMPTEYTGVSQIADYYGITRKFADKKWDKAVLQMYYDGIKEANRVLSKEGVLIVKCQDMVCANKQILVHCDLINYAATWFRCEDIFILVQTNKRPHPKKRQLHARKNHSYFLVFLRNGKKFDGFKSQE